MIWLYEVIRNTSYGFGQRCVQVYARVSSFAQRCVRVGCADNAHDTCGHMTTTTTTTTTTPHNNSNESDDNDDNVNANIYLQCACVCIYICVYIYIYICTHIQGSFPIGIIYDWVRF